VLEVDDSAHELDNWEGRVRYSTPYAGTWSVSVGVGEGWAMKEGVKSRRTDISFGLSLKERRGVKSRTTYILLSRDNRLESFGSLLRMQSIKLRMV
jgi:hypothetical protein